ncbi:MAG: hypothetical protein J6T05_00720 [Prevotella sp.]|nr:hypothetical protein [Prevotella sp.]
MKKLLIACSAMLLTLGASAQVHFGIGAGAGTTGIALDASFMLGKYVGVRGGVDIMPQFKVSKDIDLKTEDANKKVSQLTNEINQLNQQLVQYNLEPVDLSQYPGGNLPEKMEIEGKLKNTTGHVLIDLYPGGGSFHFTVGAYFGPDEVISVYNKEEGFMKPITTYNEAIANAALYPNVQQVVNQYNLKMIGGELGDYFVTPDPAEKGDVKAYAKVKGFRPYVGLGFGRAVPKKRIGCQFDLGVQFWGSPEIYVPTYDKAAKTYQYEKIEGDKAGDDAGKVLKTVSKISVYPVLNFRLVGRIF